MEWKAFIRGVARDMVMMREGAAGVILGNQGQCWGSILKFRMLAWPLMEEEDTFRGMSWVVVTRKGGIVGVMLGRYG